MKTFRTLLIGAVALVWILPLAMAQQALVYVGTYTRGASKGIYAYRFDAASGKLTSLGLAAETPNPSFLALAPNGRFLYAVNELDQFQGEKAGSVSAFAIDRAEGKLKPLNTVSSRGTGPCHLVVDRTGKCVIAANYNGGSVASFPVREDGSLGAAVSFEQHSGSGANPQRQAAPHAHSTVLSPDNRFVLSADLGLDEIFTYRLEPAKGAIAPADPPFVKVTPAGSGPRHIAFHPNGKLVYAVEEIVSDVTAFTYDAASGSLHQFQTIPMLPKGFTGRNTAAEIEVHPSGKFLYASNRGNDSIAIYSIDGGGKLALVDTVPSGGKNPRNFAIDPTGGWMLAANQDGGMVLFRIDTKTGKLERTGEPVDVPFPVSVVFLKGR